MAGLVVYSRQGCHLCEQLIEEMLPVVKDRLAIEIRDIDTDAGWRRIYGTRIPVVEYDGELVCQYHLDREALTKILSNPKHEQDT